MYLAFSMNGFMPDTLLGVVGNLPDFDNFYFNEELVKFPNCFFNGKSLHCHVGRTSGGTAITCYWEIREACI